MTDARSVNGILLLDKPAGITSNMALQRIKYLYKATKAGHTGTLDKLATGMLPICLGAATKISRYLLNADKTYITTAKPGITITADASSEVLEIKPFPPLTPAYLNKVFAQFTGNIDQIPPMYSALKVAGQRLYKLAYQNITVKREPRPVTIHQINLLDFDHESFSVRVRCSKGTYIRTLIEDIGKAIGSGAHVSSLRRLSVGVFNAEQMVTMQHIEEIVEDSERNEILLDQLLVEMSNALGHLTKICLSSEQTNDICHGRAVLVSDVPDSGAVRIYDHNHKLIGIGTAHQGYIAPKRLLIDQ